MVKLPNYLPQALRSDEPFDNLHPLLDLLASRFDFSNAAL